MPPFQPRPSGPVRTLSRPALHPAYRERGRWTRTAALRKWRRKSGPAPFRLLLNLSVGPRATPAQHEKGVSRRVDAGGWSSPGRSPCPLRTQVLGRVTHPTAPRKSSTPQLLSLLGAVGRHRNLHHPVANGLQQLDRTDSGSCPSAIAFCSPFLSLSIIRKQKAQGHL